jgi:hypothetical protein
MDSTVTQPDLKGGLIRLTPELIEEIGKAVRPQLEHLRQLWETEGPKAMAALESTGVKLDTIGGNCPVQAEGTIDGKRFYFRARGSSWQFHVAETEAEIFDNPLFYVEADYGTWPDAGWMPEHEAVHFIIVSSAAYRLERELRDAHEGQGNGGDFLAWVRNMADDNTGTLQNAARAYLQATS